MAAWVGRAFLTLSGLCVATGSPGTARRTDALAEAPPPINLRRRKTTLQESQVQREPRPTHPLEVGNKGEVNQHHFKEESHEGRGDRDRGAARAHTAICRPRRLRAANSTETRLFHSRSPRGLEVLHGAADRDEIEKKTRHWHGPKGIGPKALGLRGDLRATALGTMATAAGSRSATAKPRPGATGLHADWRVPGLRVGSR
nr:uncharacterized protein LOC127484854 [Oryctolagus cuniculus]